MALAGLWWEGRTRRPDTTQQRVREGPPILGYDRARGKGNEEASMDFGIAPDGYRLPESLELGTVRLQVTSIDRSLEFYAGLLGMSVITASGDGALLGAAGSTAALVELRAGDDPRARRRGRLGLYHFAVLLPDRAALGRVLAYLLRRGVRPGSADHLVSEALYLQDPDDLGIEIYRDRQRSEWNASGRQLAMSSDPLDATAVMAASDGAEWTGMPEGTRIGHVHLHVGSIDAARDFYHAALGFDVIVWSYPGALFMSAGGYHHHLGVNTWAGAHATAPGHDEPRLLSWDIVLPTATDVAAAVDSITHAGYAPSPEEAGGSVAHDPFGTALRLVAAR
jgi:catechol 2,3-dioxygenase